MTTFDTDGFLSDEISSWEADFENRYSSKLELSVAVNRLAHKMVYTIDIGSEDLSDLLLSTLLARQLSTFQGFVLLSRRGMIFQAEMLVRALAESMFLVGAICKKPDFAKQWVLGDEVSRKKALVRLNEDRRRRGEAPDETAVALIAELEKRIRDEGIIKPSTEQIAKLAGLESYYDTLYGFFSMAVHSSSRSLDKALQKDSDGKLTHVEYGPEIDGFDMHLDYAISMTLYVLHEIAAHFEKDVSEIEVLQKRNAELSGEAQQSVQSDRCEDAAPD
ncbi:hypothetical protein J7I44_13990 [Frateuria sp. MAH-13]|uniref:Uncharacterized protein n=1 Tax=Frateuria flava TaxID=2821489 RepID=A0ABS4DQV3_9GAMM|nr:DUF5677 domain-containing protein [Frateuria flava]MBP1475420.1 hypothetical protein [Frateuria flava]